MRAASSSAILAVWLMIGYAMGSAPSEGHSLKKTHKKKNKVTNKNKLNKDVSAMVDSKEAAAKKREHSPSFMPAPKPRVGLHGRGLVDSNASSADRYIISDEYMSYDACTEYCADHGYSTPCINDDEENAILTALIGWGEAWIGISDIEEDGTWVWEDSSCTSTYTNWYSEWEEPNGGDEEFYAIIAPGWEPSDTSGWIDVGAEDYRCVCDRLAPSPSPTVTPVPTATKQPTYHPTVCSPKVKFDWENLTSWGVQGELEAGVPSFGDTEEAKNVIGNEARDHFYVWNPIAGHNYKIATCGSRYDTWLRIYQETDCGFVQVESHDDTGDEQCTYDGSDDDGLHRDDDEWVAANDCCFSLYAYDQEDSSCCVGDDMGCDEYAGRRLKASSPFDTAERKLGHCCDHDGWCSCMEDYMEHGHNQCANTTADANATATAGGPTWYEFPNAQGAYDAGDYTWEGAVTYCQSLGGTLCSYDDLCGGASPFDGVAGDHPGTGDNWTPYIDDQYYWTNTGDDRACMQEGGDSSSWHGMSHCCEDGEDKVCCTGVSEACISGIFLFEDRSQGGSCDPIDHDGNVVDVEFADHCGQDEDYCCGYDQSCGDGSDATGYRFRCTCAAFSPTISPTTIHHSHDDDDDDYSYDESCQSTGCCLTVIEFEPTENSTYVVLIEGYDDESGEYRLYVHDQTDDGEAEVDFCGGPSLAPTVSMLPTVTFAPTANLNGCVYQEHAGSMNWYDAEALCESMGGTLPVIRSASENDEIVSLIADEGSVERGIWLGLTDEENEGEWVWIDGTSLGGYENFGGDEPNGGSGENHANMWTDGYWNDNPAGDDSLHVVCCGTEEEEPTSLPTTSPVPTTPPTESEICDKCCSRRRQLRGGRQLLFGALIDPECETCDCQDGT